MTANQSILAISGSVSFDGAGAILLSAIGQASAGSNIITSRNNIATLTDVDNNLSGTGSIFRDRLSSTRQRSKRVMEPSYCGVMSLAEHSTMRIC